MTDFSYFRPDPKKYSAPKLKKSVKKVADKNKGANGFRKPTGELALFREIFVEQNGKCWVTGKPVQFHPDCFMHVLGKKAYPSFKLYKKNIKFVEEEIHFLYDNSSKEKLLQHYPKATKIYDLKEELKTEYYKPKPTI